MHLIRRVREEERGAALVTALAVTMIMLALGIAILSIVDTQASVSATERTRDRGFNLAESALRSQAFVLGRNWPASAPVAPAPDPLHCGDVGAGFEDTLGSAAVTIPAVARLRKTLNASYTDTAYSGAKWQINLCDDDDPDGAGPTPGSTVWNASILNNRTWDVNANKRLWVVAQSTVDGEKRSLVGLVLVRENSVLPSKYGLVSGGLIDDLGSTVNTLSANALGGVLGGLLGTTPTVAADPTVTPSGITGLRCGATDIQLIPASTCVAGTIGALGALPVVNNLLTGGKLVQFPSLTTATPANIDQLRSQAIAAGTYKDVSPGESSVTTNQACQVAGSPTASSIVFIEKVGDGNQWCVLNVPVGGLSYRAVVVGSGRIIIRGAAITAGSPVSTTSRTFAGVVYALNRQRLPVADGGRGLGDSATPVREVVRIEQGAHVKGGVYADGKSAKIGIYPPNLTLTTNTLVNSLLCPGALCVLAPTLNGLLGVLGVDGTVDALINGTCLVKLLGICTINLPGLGLNTVVSGIVNQLSPQRAAYGSAIISDVNAINSLTAYGASGVVPGSFRDLQGR